MSWVSGYFSLATKWFLEQFVFFEFPSRGCRKKSVGLFLTRGNWRMNMGTGGVSDGCSSGILHLAFLAGKFMTFMQRK